MLGNLLLNSQDGAEVKILEQKHNHDPYDIVYHIFQKWRTTDETPTWKKLVQCLRYANLDQLAKNIEGSLQN